jgi:hypothetical protein
MKHSVKLLPAVLAGIAVLGGCAAGSYYGRNSESQLDRKFSLTSYIEEGTQVALIVGVRPAGIVKDQGYVPFEIGVANKGLEELTITPESFVLIDDQGNRYPAVSAEELYREYRRVDVDRRLGEIFQVMLGKFQTYSIIQSNFTPSFDAPTLVPTAHLPRYSMIYDLLYFPEPEDGVRGRRFELFMSAPELEDPVFVQFQVGGKSGKP